MKVSYQDIAVRLAVVEDKLDMVMNLLSVTTGRKHPISDEIIQETRTFLDLYREMKWAGMPAPQEAGQVDGLPASEQETVDEQVTG